jgi:murein DD-endopeptidase MepM/ murein hydrolase activator NlpD
MTAFLNGISPLPFWVNQRKRFWLALGLCALLMGSVLGSLQTVEARSWWPWGGGGGSSSSSGQLKQRKTSLSAKRANLRKLKQQKLRQAQLHESALVVKQKQLFGSYQSLAKHQDIKADVESSMSTIEGQLDQTVGDVSRLTLASASRIRQLYMTGRLQWLEMMLNAKNLNDWQDRLYYQQKIVAFDRQMLGSLREKMGIMRKQQNELNTRKTQLSSAIQSIQSYQVAIKSQVEQERSLRDKYLNDASYYERLERQLLAESYSIERQLRSLQVQKVARSTGALMWPVSGPVTSGFGYRRHPIFGGGRMHTGIDVSRPTGTPIVAADGGTVFFAGWRGGYGKAIIINHGSRGGGNLATLYGHLSSIAVGSGQTVSKGQIIGYVGSTGHSTGPHLHFEVRSNGRPVNPLGYL